MPRKMFASLDVALKTAQSEANDRREAVRIWRLVKKDKSLRFDVLYLNETPKGEGWEMVSEIAPEHGEPEP
jgi:hypothetical protein